MPKVTITAGKNASVSLSTGTLATQQTALSLAQLLDGTGSASAIAPSPSGHQFVAVTLSNGNTQAIDISQVTAVTGS